MKLVKTIIYNNIYYNLKIIIFMKTSIGWLSFIKNLFKNNISINHTPEKELIWFDEAIYEQNIIDSKFKEKYRSSLIESINKIVVMIQNLDYAPISDSVNNYSFNNSNPSISATKYISINKTGVYFSTAISNTKKDISKTFHYRSSLSDIKEYVDEVMPYYIWNKLTPFEILLTSTQLVTKYLHKDDSERADYVWKILTDFTTENQELVSFYMVKNTLESNIDEKKLKDIILENIDEKFIQDFSNGSINNNYYINSNSFFPPLKTYLKYFFHLASEEQKVKMADLIAEKIKSFKWISSIKKIQVSKKLIPSEYLMEAIK